MATKRKLPHLGDEELVNYAEGSDSSEDEDGPVNRIGNVPLWWYDDYDHIGYDIDGKKIMRKANDQDRLDEFLKRMDDPNALRTIYDAVNDRKIVLSDEELRMIHRIRHNKFPHADFDPDTDLGDFETSIKEIHPLGNPLEPKRRFIPSKWEQKRIMKYVNAMRNGWIPVDEEEAEKNKKKKPDAYLMWGDDGNAVGRQSSSSLPVITAPKPKMPGHNESYNPPAEYLMSEEERKAWLEADPEDRATNFIPHKYGALRHVPVYSNFVKERFERCLDLYLCPRTKKKKLNIDPESLLPKLPSPSELRPFPSNLSIEYIGHSATVNCFAISPSGQWMASGSENGEVRLWEINTGRCMRLADLRYLVKSDDFAEGVVGIAWNPNPALPILAVAIASKIMFYNTETGTDEDNKAATTLLVSGVSAAAGSAAASWEVQPEGANVLEEKYLGEAEEGEVKHAACEAIALLPHLVIDVDKQLKSISWHNKGDYLASVTDGVSANSVLIHRLSKKQTQAPFTRSKGIVSQVVFHPSKPVIFIGTLRHIRVYDLVQQQLLKKLRNAGQRVASISVHPSGDHVLVGSQDRRLSWFDLDYSTSPFKTIRYHKGSVNGVSYHNRYPLFASCSYDGTVHVYHGMVYNDLMQNPLIVPLKILHAHPDGVTAVQFHPTQPWLFSAGTDSIIKLFT